MHPFTTKTSHQMIVSGLDQLFFTPLAEDETIEDRSDIIENFLSSNGWTWNDILIEMENEYDDYE